MTVQDVVHLLDKIEGTINCLEEMNNALNDRHDMDEHFLSLTSNDLNTACDLLTSYRKTILNTKVEGIEE